MLIIFSTTNLRLGNGLQRNHQTKTNRYRTQTGGLIGIEINRTKLIWLDTRFHPIPLYAGMKSKWIGMERDGINGTTHLAISTKINILIF